MIANLAFELGNLTSIPHVFGSRELTVLVRVLVVSSPSPNCTLRTTTRYRHLVQERRPHRSGLGRGQNSGVCLKLVDLILRTAAGIANVVVRDLALPAQAEELRVRADCVLGCVHVRRS